MECYLQFYPKKISKWNGERMLRPEPDLGSGNSPPFPPTDHYRQECREIIQVQPSKEVGFTSARNRHMYHEGSRFGKYNSLILLPE